MAGDLAARKASNIPDSASQADGPRIIKISLLEKPKVAATLLAKKVVGHSWRHLPKIQELFIPIQSYRLSGRENILGK